MLNPAGERFRNNLRQLSTSQTSIETLSKYAQFHADDSEAIVNVWWEEFTRADPSRCLAFVYLLNDIAHASKGRSNPFIPQFEPRLMSMVDHIIKRCDTNVQSRVLRTLKVWQQRLIFDPTLVTKLVNQLENKPEPFVNQEKNTLIDLLKQHDNAALEDVLIAASAAPYLSNPSLQGLNPMRAHETRLEARRSRIQQLIAFLAERLNSEKASLAACLSDLSVCRSKIEQCQQDSPSNKRPRLDSSSSV